MSYIPSFAKPGDIPSEHFDFDCRILHSPSNKKKFCSLDMIIASCPLWISLFGSSTDNPYFVDKYGYGSVISFTSNLEV